MEEMEKGHKPAPALLETVITPSKGWLSLNLREVWQYRELLGILTWRDVSVRYKQSVAGVGWAIFQPLLTALIFTIIFGKFAKLPSDGIPYPIYAYCALLPWNYFARSLGGASDSIVDSSHLITKVYFPRLILPISKVLSGLIDFLIALLIMVGMMVWYKISPTRGLIYLPLFIFSAMLTALGIGLWFTALNVKYRDIRFLVPFITQVWMYATPVAYSIRIVPENLKWVYALNPMVGVIEGFRWALLGKAPPSFQMIIFPMAIVLVLLAGGFYYFKRMEKMFADIV